MQHLKDIKDLTQADVERLFSTATKLSQTTALDNKKRHLGRSAVALFFENSTRTLCSFQMACQRLGMDVTALNVAHSSTQKGETMKDTVLTLDAMQPDCFIIRHQQNHMPARLIEWLGDRSHVINAGDGTHQHPTQGLLDLYTIRQHKPDFKQLKVCLIGDIKHSRVANSLLDGLRIMQTQNISLYAPDALIPEALKGYQADSLRQAIADSDVVVMLRIQKERFEATDAVSFDDWHEHYGLNQARLKWAKPDAIVMHPGPMNRGIEISDQVADGSQSVILEQVRNGVLLRQAVLHELLSN